ncbi:beta strand repeat-containing protein, partial [Pseudomonadota bacterium]
TGNIIINGSNSLIVDGEGDASRAVSYSTGGYSLTVGGSITLGVGSDSGTKNLNITNSTVQVAGNYTVNSGTNTVTSTGSTLVFNGTGAQSVTTANKTLNNIEVTNSSAIVSLTDTSTINDFKAIQASTQLTFTAGITYNIGGDLVLNGQDVGTRIQLRSTGAYTLNVTAGTQAVSYVDVQYAEASGNDILAGDSIEVGTTTDADDVSPYWQFVGGFPFGGYTANSLIPEAQISQSTSGDGVMTINFRVKDSDLDAATLKDFQYSVDGGATWAPATAGDLDASASLSSNWDDNGGGGYGSKADWSGTVHNFTFDTQHVDVSGTDGVDQSDVRIRFMLNDGGADSSESTVSDNFQVDNLGPNSTITSALYNAVTNKMRITGTNFDSIATISTDVKSAVDWSKLIWDINGTNGSDITFDGVGVTSLVITDATTLTITFTTTKSNSIEATTGYGPTGGDDKLDVTAGFLIDMFGNLSVTDAVVNGELRTNARPVGGYTADNIIPTAQITQATDGSGTITVNWKARDDESENVTLNSFQFSTNSGGAWVTPTNGDASAAFSANWDDNGGSGFTTATTLGSASAHSFTVNTKHTDLSALNGVDLSTIKVRFTINDGVDDSAAPAESQDFALDNVATSATITSAVYRPNDNDMTITGTNLNTVATNTTDIASIVDWTQLIWDINSDDATTTNIAFDGSGVTSLVVDSDTQLTLTFGSTKAGNIEGTTDFGGTGGFDGFDIATGGFFKDAFGNSGTADIVDDASITLSIPAVVANGFVQTNWQAGIRSIEAECNTAGGTWTGTLCSATHTNNITGWQSYASKTTDIGAINAGEDISLSVVQNLEKRETLQTHFEAGVSNGLDLTNDQIKLIGTTADINVLEAWPGMHREDLGWGGGLLPGAGGDLDGDGDIDFVIVHEDKSIVYGWENTGGAWSNNTDWNVDTGINANTYNQTKLVVFDYDLDGDIDIYVENTDPAVSNKLYLNPGVLNGSGGID